MTKKFTSTIAGASILITGVGLISRGVGFFREIIFANYFGLSSQFDQYLLSTVLPVTINTVVLYIAQNYLIPNYNRLKESSSDESIEFLSRTFWSFVLIGFLVFLIFFFFAESIIGLYFSGSDSNSILSTVKIFRIFIITIPLNAAVSVLAAYLQAELEFKFPSFSQLLLNVSVIFLVIISTKEIGIYSIPAGYVIGTILQLSYLLFYVRRIFSINYLFRKRAKLFSLNFSFLLIILIEAISQVYLIADRILYEYVPAGSVAALNYAFNVYLLPVSIISMAISIAIFPHLSRTVSLGSIDELSGKLNNFFTINSFLFIPITFIFFFYGDVIIQLLFMRGAFTSDDSKITFEVLKVYSISLLFYSSYSVLNKLLYSSNMIKQLALITVAGCIIKVVLNFLLVHYYQHLGLALGTVFSFLFFFISAFLITVYKLKAASLKNFLKELFFIAAIGLVSFLFVTISGINSVTKSVVLKGLFSIILFSTVFFINAILLKLKSIELLLSVFKVKIISSK
jgi:putative peptidoglycan lipid II flippase